MYTNLSFRFNSAPCSMNSEPISHTVTNIMCFILLFNMEKTSHLRFSFKFRHL